MFRSNRERGYSFSYISSQVLFCIWQLLFFLAFLPTVLFQMTGWGIQRQNLEQFGFDHAGAVGLPIYGWMCSLGLLMHFSLGTLKA